MKIQEFLKYLKHKRNYSDLTVQSYESDLLQFENFLVKDDNDFSVLQDDNLISVNAVRSWIMTLSEQGISARSINRKISSLKSYFKWCEMFDTEFKNPMLKIIPPKTKKRKLASLSNDDISSLLSLQPNANNFDDFRNFLIIEILYATGIRQAELLNIEEKDISFTNKQLRVLGKGNKERIIPIEEKLIDSITQFIDLKRRYNIKESRLIVSSTGKPISKYQLYSIVHRLLENYNVSERSAHIFRHTCATHLVGEGADIVNVKNLLGHSSLKATEVYTHTTIEQLKSEYKKKYKQ
ncbi:MAG: tyrosine-type recombinase/integrase [Bacteroidales bacterium]|nr:tyrosine-type recombinase/integrase [Bacteroidales bacterium]